MASEFEVDIPYLGSKSLYVSSPVHAPLCGQLFIFVVLFIYTESHLSQMISVTEIIWIPETLEINTPNVS